MDTTTRTGTPLRQRMLEDMRMRKLEDKTMAWLGRGRAVPDLTVADGGDVMDRVVWRMP